MSDCYNVKAHIGTRTYNSTKLKRLVLLTQWLTECLEQIRTKDRFVFPVEEEKILFNEIKAEIKSVNPDLKLFDMQDFRFISISEHDYQVNENLNFNKFIAKCLFSSYISILEEIPNIKRLPYHLQVKLKALESSIANLKSDNRINLELDSSTRAKTDKYLIMRRDIESLYTIDSIITSLKDTIKKNTSHAVKLLALQRILHTAGENLKDTSATATVSSDLKESLEKLGIPVNFLNIFRDMLMHNQVYSLLTVERNYIEKFFHGCVVIQKLIQRKMIELQNNFIESIIEETQIDKDFRTVLTKLSRENDLITLKFEIKRKMARLVSGPDDRIPEEQKQSLGFLYQNVNHMIFESKEVSTSELSTKDVKSLEFVTQRINQVRSQIYKKLQSQLKLWDFEKFIGELKNANLPKLYLDTIEAGQVIDHLNYKNKDESILYNFLERPILQEIYVKPQWTLKEELKLYIDTNFINNDNTYVAGKYNEPDMLVEHLFNNMQNADDNVKKLITFLKSKNLNNKDLDTYIPPREYNRLVYDLPVSQESKTLVLSLSVASRKQQIAYLLKKYFPLVTIFENVMEGKVINRSVFEMFVRQYTLKQESKVSLEQITKSFNTKVQEFYIKRVIEEWSVFITLNQAEVLKSEFIILTSLVHKIDKAGEADKDYRVKNNWKNMLYQLNEFRKKIAHHPTIINANDMKILDNTLVDTVNEIRSTETNTVEDIMTHLSSMQKRFSLKNAGISMCASTSGRNRRYASKSCWTWEEIDKFSEEGVENRDPDNIRIDGEKFIRSIISMEHVANEEKISNAIALASHSVFTGDHTSKINMLTDNHRFLGHLGRVGKVSGMVMHGMIIKDLMADLFRGDYEDLAKTIGILAVGTGLQIAAEIASIKGASYILKSRIVLGNTLKFASPYLARGASAFIAWDLYKQVKAYEEGNKEALVYIIGDSAQLGIDVGEIGIEVGEVFGLLNGVSAYSGPIGMALGALVMVGINIYTTVRTVQKIDDYFHLTVLEKIAEGILTFFGQGDSEIEQDIEEIEANNQEVKRITCLLKDNPHIRRYVFPSTEIKTKEESKFVAKRLNNAVYLDIKLYDIKWSSSRPSYVYGFDLFCQPKGDSVYAPNGRNYYCDNAIGVENGNSKTGNNTWISLGDGDDEVRGFPDSSNIFVFGDGHKSITGGNKDDSFIFEGKSVDASYDSEIGGSILGRGGIDTIDADKLTARYADSKGVGKYQVSVDFRAGILKDTSKVFLNIYDINVFLGRKGGVDEVLFACDTKHVDGRGGENNYYLDSIIIPKDDACSYNSTVTINPYTKVTNNAARGKFHYIVKGEKGKEAYIELGPSSQSINTFVFDYALTDVAAINKSEENITFSFVDEFYEREKKIDVNSSFNLTVSGADKNATTYHLTDLTKIVIGQNNVYALQNTEKPIVDLVKDYSSIADKSEMYVVVHSNNEVLTIGHKHGDVLSNDPNARASHLASGDGENIFVISSGHESITLANLPISDVVIYDFNQGDKIDTLDLREIKEQIKKDIDREINTDISKIASDLLITLSLDDASKQEVVKIRLKDTLENNWHERLHVVIDNIFVFKEILGDIQLTPQPLILDDNSKTIYIINPTDVVKGSKITVKKEIGYYSFARNIDALIITNSLSSSTAENNVITIMLNDFYYGNNQDQMHSLKIEFDDKTIFLRREIERINSAGNFSELTRKVTNDRYKTAIYTIKTQKLFEAIEGNNIGEVEEFIEHGVRIDARNNAGQTPLHVAALNGNLGIVKYLIEEKHADVNINDNPGIKSLYCAVSGSTLDVIKYLVRTVHGHVNVKANYGIKPLHYAAFSGNLEVVKYLVEEKHADVNVKDNYEITPLHYAASSSSSSLNVVKYLVEKKLADINVKDIYEITPLQYAVLGGNLEVVKYLVDEKRARLYASDHSEITILYYAVFSGNLEVVKYLVEEKHVRVDLVDNLGLTLLHYAASRSSLNVVKYLVEEKHADANAKNNNISVTPLYYAAAGGNLEVLKYLLEDNSPDTYLIYAVRGGASADVNKEPSLLGAFLHYAACDDNLGVIKYLIEEKHADVNGNDTDFDFDSTPIPYAAATRSLNVVKYLLAVQDADVNVKDKNLWLPLFYAADAKNVEVIKYLVEQEDAGTDVKNYLTAAGLEIVTSDANLELVKYLVGKGADVNANDNSATTPLHDAAKSGSIEVVKYLIEKGARIDIKLSGETPLNILERNGYKHVVDSIVENLTERLFDAVKYDDYYEVQNLLNQGVSSNVQVGGEETLLYFAARNGKVKVVKYLIEQMYPVVNVKDYSVVTPVQVVDNTNIDKANTDVEKYLGGEQAGVNLEDLFRWTATFNRSLKVQTRFYRQAPLDLAVAGNYSNIVEHLESKVNVKRETPQEHERSHHHPSRRLLTTDLTNQPEIATSNASEKSLWINDLGGSIVKSQKSSAPSETASSNHTIRHERRKRHNDHSRHEDGMCMRTHRVRRRHRRVQKRNVKYQDSHYYTDQPEIAASSGTRPSSWINGLVDWIKEKGGGLVSSMANKFAGKEVEDRKSRGIDACSVRLEKMYSAATPNIPQSRKSQGVPKGNIPNTSWSGWSSDQENVRSNVTDAPEMNTIVLNCALILGDLAVRLVNGTRHKQPIHENLLSPREKSMRFIDENMIMRTIQQGKEKFGGLATNMDEEQIWNWEISG